MELQEYMNEHGDANSGTEISFFDFAVYIKPKIRYAIEQHIYALGEDVFDTLALPKETMCNLLIAYMTNGKLWRSSLFLYMLLSYVGKERFENEYTHYLDIGVSIEFLQAFLLMHDDVMDNDDTRRNIPSMHKSFQSILQTHSPPHYQPPHSKQYDDTSPHTEETKRGGESLAICFGDILYTFVFKILGRHTDASKIIPVYANYVMKVGAGQFNDVYWSHIPTASHISSDDILQMYKQKTGAYTFSLPFVLAALCADSIMPDTFDIQKEIQQLDILGNTMGVLFQIQDDVMGAFYDESITGKPKGSDFIEKKHTYLFSLLTAALSHNNNTEEYALLSDMFQQPIGSEEVKNIIAMMKKHTIIKKIERLQLEYTTMAYGYIDELHIQQNKAYLKDFTAYLNTRER